MIEDVENYLDSIVIGIRFRPNFSIMDNFGSMIDEILYSKDSYFNEKYFPLVHHASHNERILSNKENKHLLTINPSNIILDTKEENNDYSNVVDSFNKQIIEGLFINYGIQQIKRIGEIRRYKIEDKELCDNFLKKTISYSISGINDINLRFSKKYPIPESKVHKKAYDYHNVIYTIVKKSDENVLNISLDFQKYFEPVIEKATMIEFNKFKERVVDYNKKDFREWLDLFLKDSYE